MKKFTLISIVLMLILSACQQQKPKATYYKVQGSKTILNQEAYNGFLKKVEKQFKSSTAKFMEVHQFLLDSMVSHDSIIKTIKIQINLSDKKPKKEKIYSLLNQPFPETILSTIHNKSIDLSTLRGKPTVLNFWFTTCTPCIEEMPVLNKIKQKFEGKVNFIAITFSSQKSVAQFLKTHRFDYRQVAGADSLTKALGIEFYPKNIILDKDGVVKEITGSLTHLKNGKEVAGDGKDFEAAINAILNGRKEGFRTMEILK